MRSTHPGARALTIAALIGTLLVSIAPASSITAAEPPPADATTVVDPVTAIDSNPAGDPSPQADPASPSDPPPAEPGPAVDPTPAADAVSATAASATTAAVRPAPRTTEAQQIIRIAKRHLGAPWRHGARGPRAFDCSGLVIYAFRKAGDSRAIGRGRLVSARALYRWFKAHHKASRTHPRIGDLVIWGRGTHVGIYIGHGKAISTLTGGVRIHRVHAVTARFTAYLHTGMWQLAAH